MQSAQLFSVHFERTWFVQGHLVNNIYIDKVWCVELQPLSSHNLRSKVYWHRAQVSLLRHLTVMCPGALQAAPALTSVLQI